jgi:hypothetical protein
MARLDSRVLLDFLEEVDKELERKITLKIRQNPLASYTSSPAFSRSSLYHLASSYWFAL